MAPIQQADGPDAVTLWLHCHDRGERPLSAVTVRNKQEIELKHRSFKVSSEMWREARMKLGSSGGRAERWFFAAIVLCTLGVIVPPARAGEHGEGAARGWICQAYGYGGKRNTWQFVSGARSSSKAAAYASAASECRRRGLRACSGRGCWSGHR